MPAKNSRKILVPHHYYHVYNRGVAKQPIFLDAADKKKLLDIFARHLDPDREDVRDDGKLYKHFEDLELLCYCLMGNHFHLLFYVNDDAEALKQCLQQVMTAYAMYFNKKYKRVGPLFQGVYKASMILKEGYLLHISRYIHMNPRRYKTYYYSSLPYYTHVRSEPRWLKPQRILNLFEGYDYVQFLEDYEDARDTLQEVKAELAAG
ncbi:MAG: transposase [Candidatus Saccharimonadales bacterium]